MERRAFIGTMTGVLVAAPLAAEAQQPGKVARIGFLTTPSATAASYYLEAFREGLRELGYVEGKTIAIEYRFAEGRPERLPALAAELKPPEIYEGFIMSFLLGATTQASPRNCPGSCSQRGPKRAQVT
jgi:hypothetical protein